MSASAGSRAVSDAVREFHTTSVSPPVAALSAHVAFGSLAMQERLYVHYMAKACWAGGPIVLHQVSPESPHLFALFNAVFQGSFQSTRTPSSSALDAYRAAVRAAGGEALNTAFDRYLEFAGTFYANMGNYLSFGDSKFIPRCTRDEFLAISLASPSPSQPSTSADDAHRARIQSLLDACIDAVYNLDAHVLSLGFPCKGGVSTYYSPNVTEGDMQLVQSFLTQQHISPYNTRLFKDAKTGEFEVRIAAAAPRDGGTHRFGPAVIHIKYGDFSVELAAVVENLRKAIPYAANPTQVQMLEAYIESFTTGSIDAHKKSQRLWVTDVNPIVEVNIGFIESYRDPFGVRGEWEGFVSVVNKETSRKFGVLVEKAPSFLTTLPWPAVFEKDEFKRPDFTSLEVVAFACSGVPAGINIPNYDDIRQTIGFKNVSLGNVLSAKSSVQKFTFLADEDQQLYADLRQPAFDVQVGCHELLGHGSGKVFHEEANGTFNFPLDALNPLTGKPLREGTWYKSGDTYDSKFLSLGSAMEECRAECVGIYLSCDENVLSIFGHVDAACQADIMYINWLHMVRAGVLALEMYTPETGMWRQAHMRARHAILRVLLKAGQGFVTIDKSSDGGVVVRLDRRKILSVGRPAIAAFLTQIQVYKSTADVTSAKALFAEFTSVQGEFLALRDTVLALREPRREFVQANTFVAGEQQHAVELVEYEPTHAGIIHSMIDRYVM